MANSPPPVAALPFLLSLVRMRRPSNQTALDHVGGAQLPQKVRGVQDKETAARHSAPALFQPRPRLVPGNRPKNSPAIPPKPSKPSECCTRIRMQAPLPDVLLAHKKT
jgi:hypothetical protein